MMELSGVVVACITPLSQDGLSLAREDAFAAYYRFLLQQGVHGVFVCGTTGEGPLLSLDERKKVADLAMKYVGGRIPVIVHAGAITTDQAVDLARHAASIGADGIAVVTPFFYPLDEEAIFRHYRTVAGAVPHLPVYLYNIPSFARNEVSASLIARLRPACPNIVGMKHSDANLVRLQEFQQAGGPDFAIFSGSDAVALAALTIGARGCVSGNASAVPEVLLALYQAVRAGDLEAARRAQDRMHEVRALLGDGLNLAAFKAALRIRGISVGGVRAPHRGLTTEEETRLERGMADFRLRGYVASQVA
jgi:dihydrodipicolinate synthase/N-acetylneuraminate lyase